MSDKVRVKELFTSIQGEGPFIGYKQLFIRFCGCNLTCSYCDTDYRTVDSVEYNLGATTPPVALALSTTIFKFCPILGNLFN